VSIAALNNCFSLPVGFPVHLYGFGSYVAGFLFRRGDVLSRRHLKKFLFNYVGKMAG